VVQALVEHERLTRQAGGAVLRIGHLYGPGSAYAADGSFVADVRAGKVPLVGGGDSVFSFTHAADAATAVVAALDKPFTGVLNIVDDDPAPMREWLPELARIVDAPSPKRVPKALARLATGSFGAAFMTALAGADNRRARLHLDWRPGHPSWRTGFASELSTAPGRGMP
jgi:nucleoside-diphosphate-sugar epimerase